MKCNPNSNSYINLVSNEKSYIHIAKKGVSIAIILMLCVISSTAQIFSPPKPDGSGNTYAIVVGISEYENREIPRLKYAHEDAISFANFLRSDAGGNVPNANIKLFTDQEAQSDFIMEAIYNWINIVTPENGQPSSASSDDQFIFYFSGHGDVDKVDTENADGYLLCYNAPNGMYELNGTISIPKLEEKMTTVAGSGAKVILVVDACRSGKVFGNASDGSSAMAKRIISSFQNTIKFLSCNHDEQSMEGVTWGGGRGAFSYHLINGLYGLADGYNLNKEKDNFVQFKELSRYVEDKVQEEVQSRLQKKQTPQIQGTVSEDFVMVYDSLRELAQTQKITYERLQSSNDFLTDVGAETLANYAGFEETIKKKKFFYPREECADFFYTKLIANQDIQDLHQSLTTNYATALQNYTNPFINNLIKADLKEGTLSGNDKITFERCASYMARAGELLQSDKIDNPETYADLYKEIMAKKYFFEGKAHTEKEDQKKAFREALKINPRMATALLEIIPTFKTIEADSAEYYAAAADSLRPKWVMPTLRLYDYYAPFDTVRSIELLEKASKINPKAPYFWWRQANTFEKNKKYRVALKYYALVDSLKAQGADMTGVERKLPIRMGNCLHQLKFYNEAINQFMSISEVDIDSVSLFKKFRYLSRTHYQLGKQLGPETTYGKEHLTKARDYAQDAIDINWLPRSTHFLKGHIYKLLGNNQAAKRELEFMGTDDTDDDGWEVKFE